MTAEIFFYLKKYGKINGGSGHITIDARKDIPYDWSLAHCLWGAVTDRSAGISYRPPMIKGGGGDARI